MSLANASGFAVSVTEENIEMKKKILDCLIGEEGEKRKEIFGGVNGLPDLLKEFSSMLFLEVDRYLPYDKEVNLFLLLNQLFGDTYLADSEDWIYDDEDEDDNDCDEDEEDKDGDDWDEDEEDEDGDDWDEDDWDESGEVNGTKSVTIYVPDGLKECTFMLSICEMLDMGGGSNGADIDFVDESGIEEKQLDKEIPDDSFVEELLGKAKEKGYTDLADLINEKVRGMD